MYTLKIYFDMVIGHNHFWVIPMFYTQRDHQPFARRSISITKYHPSLTPSTVRPSCLAPYGRIAMLSGLMSHN